MNLRRLSFDSMPPFEVPFRFFITAPVFAIIVSCLFLFAEPLELSSRWTNLILATTHGLTLGFMLMVMIGALFQILPVILGVSMPKAKQLSKFVHFFLVIGIVSLMFGLYLTSYLLLIISTMTLAISIAAFLLGLISCIPAMRNTSSSWAIRLAVVSLFITVIFGISFSVGWINPEWFTNYRFFTNIHLLWGFIGWTFLLVMGVSFRIIPMFYVTPDYPKFVSHLLPIIIFTELIMVSFVTIDSVFSFTLLILLTITTSIYPAYTLYLISQRKRKAKDVTILFWKTAMIGFLISAGLFLVIIFYDGSYLKRLEMILAGTLLFGYAIALITGMLLKIVPFLVWLNLQQSWIKHPSRKMPLNNMQQVIPFNIAKRQYILFITMYLFLIISLAGFQSLWMIKTTALMMLANFSYLFYNLIKAYQLYQKLAVQLS